MSFYDPNRPNEYKMTMLFPKIVIIFIWINGSISLNNCPGSCTPPSECKSNGGRIIGYCTNEKACCDYINRVWGTCGMTIRGTKISNFMSPMYPQFSSGSLVCTYNLELSHSTAGIRIDFLDIYMDSIPSDTSTLFESPNSACDSDMMFIKGFSDWSPDARCGNLTDYAILVEKEPGQRMISIVFVMSSSRYRWNLRLTQIHEQEVEHMSQLVTNLISHTRNPSSKRNSASLAGIQFPLPLPPPFPIPPPFTIGGASGNEGDTAEDYDANIDGLDGDIEHNIWATPFILEGQNAIPNQVPWQVSIQSVEQIETGLCGDNRNMSLHICGGSIIDDNTIVTANHCFLSPSKNPHPILDVSQLKVVVGEHDFCQTDEVPFTKTYSISSIILHFNYLSTDIVNDLALVRLTERITFNKGVQPISIAPPDLKLTELKPLLTGWGSLGVDGNYTFPHILQSTTELRILSEEECSKSQNEYLGFSPWRKLSHKYTDIMHRGICTRGRDDIVQAGYGDSGGPLAAVLENPVLLGVVSHYRPEMDPLTNATYNLNYFTKVSAFRKWILMGMVPI